MYNVHCMFVCAQAMEWNNCDILHAVFAIQVWGCKTLFPVKAYNLKVNGKLYYWNKNAHKYLIVIDILCMNEFLPKENEPSFAQKKCSCCK